MKEKELLPGRPSPDVMGGEVLPRKLARGSLTRCLLLLQIGFSCSLLGFDLWSRLTALSCRQAGSL